MVEQLENSLRIKVTGKCNRNCCFCHQEGGMIDLDEIYYTEELKQLINTLVEEFAINSIALTGGEPLVFDGLTDLVKSISTQTQVKKFSLTTNGTVEKDENFWREMQLYGLYKVNISMPDILSNIKTDGATSSGIEVFQNQTQIIKFLSELGIKVNINIVVYNDLKYLLNILNTLFKSKSVSDELNIALLPDLTNKTTFARSQVIIQKILESLNCEKTKLSHRRGTSNTVCDYETIDGHHLQVKTTKPNGTPKWLNSICSVCNNKAECQEGFYGLRLEKRSNKLLIRMCLYKSDKNVLMSLDDFQDSPVFRELKTIWSANTLIE